MKQNKGISLIVLVVTIIVMIVISGAVIISLTNSNVIDMGEQAVQKHNQQSVEEAITLAYQDVLVKSLGKINEQDFAERLEFLSKTYTEIQNITAGNGKVYYNLSLTGKEYQISTSTGEIKEYIDSYEKVIGNSLWVRQGNSITGYTGTGDDLINVTVPNVLKDSNGNEVKITTVTLKGIDFQGTLIISSGLIIKEQSFQSCNNLEKVVIGDNVQINVGVGINNIGSFKDCTSLKTVTMGRNIKVPDGSNTNSWPFVNCTALESVTIESISGAGQHSFKGIGKALKGNIIINEGITFIGKEAFNGCTSIESITLPSTLTTVNASSFANCKNAKINFPENIKTIGESAFNGCGNMTIDLKINEGTTVGQFAFNNSGIKSLVIEDGINIPAGSFQTCKNLEIATIGDNVNIVLNDGYQNRSLFQNCTALKTVTMGENISIGDANANNSWSFINCTALETVTVKSLSFVGNRAFLAVGKALKGSIKINEDVTSIGNNAFNGCTSIESITLPSTLTTVNERAFSNCTGLQSLVVNMTEEEFSSVTKGASWNTNVPAGVIKYLEPATN